MYNTKQRLCIMKHEWKRNPEGVPQRRELKKFRKLIWYWKISLAFRFISFFFVDRIRALHVLFYIFITARRFSNWRLQLSNGWSNASNIEVFWRRWQRISNDKGDVRGELKAGSSRFAVTAIVGIWSAAAIASPLMVMNAAKRPLSQSWSGHRDRRYALGEIRK